MKLHFDLIKAPESSPTKTMVFLHGILGTGANLRSVARRFCQARPEWQGALMDLRAHGKSQSVDGDDTIGSAGDDVRQTVADFEVPVRGTLGHSFGGKVILSLLDLPKLEHAFSIDSAPGTRVDARGSESTLEIVSLLEQVSPVWETREKFVDHVVSLGQSKSIAQWLAMNLEREGTGMRLVLTMPRIRALLASYLKLDFWSAVEHSTPKVHLVIADQSRVYDEAERAQALELEASTNGRVTVDVLPAGHWVHVDDFEGLVRVLVARTSS